MDSEKRDKIIKSAVIGGLLAGITGFLIIFIPIFFFNPYSEGAIFAFFSAFIGAIIGSILGIFWGNGMKKGILGGAISSLPGLVLGYSLGLRSGDPVIALIILLTFIILGICVDIYLRKLRN